MLENFDLNFPSKPDTNSTKDNVKAKLQSNPHISSQPRYQYYLVRGIAKDSGDRKVVSVVAQSGAGEEAIIHKSKLCPPCETKLDVKRTKPSDRQVEYAKKLNIEIPPEATFEDLSALISIQNGEDSNDLASHGLLSFAAIQNICVSPYAGTQYAVMKLLRNLNDNPLNTFFCYFIYCYYFGKEIENLYDLEFKAVFEEFEAYPFHDDHFEIINSFTLDEISALLHKRSINRRERRKANYIDHIKGYLFQHELLSGQLT